MRHRTDTGVETPIASLIDVVFLLIIFFVVTASIEKDIVDESIRLAQAKYVPANDRQDPRTVTINVGRSGAVNISLTPMNLTQLTQILRATKANSGDSVPIVIRSDKDTLFNEIDAVMQAVGRAGLYRVRLSAIAGGQ